MLLNHLILVTNFVIEISRLTFLSHCHLLIHVSPKCILSFLSLKSFKLMERTIWFVLSELKSIIHVFSRASAGARRSTTHVKLLHFVLHV